MSNFGKLLDTAAIWAMAGMSALFLYIFYLAYSDPDYKVIVRVNVVGEANFEAIMFALIGVVCLVSIVRYFIRAFKEEK